jgi:hypothetical protein
MAKVRKQFRYWIEVMVEAVCDLFIVIDFTCSGTHYL